MQYYRTAREERWDQREEALQDFKANYLKYDPHGGDFIEHVEKLKNMPIDPEKSNSKKELAQLKVVKDLKSNQSGKTNARLIYLCAEMTDYDYTKIGLYKNFSKLRDVLSQAQIDAPSKFNDEKFTEAVKDICVNDEPRDETSIELAAISYNKHENNRNPRIYHAADQILNHSTPKTADGRLSKLRGLIGEICLKGAEKNQRFQVDQDGKLAPALKNDFQPVI